MVGQTYKKNSHAGLAYQLITFPSLVRIMAINVQENIDTTHETMITPMHISTCLMYIPLLISVSDNAEFDCITQIYSRKREPIWGLLAQPDLNNNYIFLLLRALCIFKWIEYPAIIILAILTVLAMYCGHLITNAPKKSKNTRLPRVSCASVSDK